MIILSQDKNGNFIITQNPDPEHYDEVFITNSILRAHGWNKYKLLQVIRNQKIIVPGKHELLAGGLYYLGMDGDIIALEHSAILRVVHSGDHPYGWTLEPIVESADEPPPLQPLVPKEDDSILRHPIGDLGSNEHT